MFMIRNLMNSETGATAIEYGLIVAFIALVSIVAFSATGNHLVDGLKAVGNKFH